MLDGGGVYIHTGGVWVYGDTDGVADEDAPQHPPAIVAWRAANERAVLDAGGRLIMPGLVYGHDGGLDPAFFGDARIIGDGANHWPLVHVEDIADLYVRALDAAPGSALHRRRAGRADHARGRRGAGRPRDGSISPAGPRPDRRGVRARPAPDERRAPGASSAGPRATGLAGNLPRSGPAVR